MDDLTSHDNIWELRKTNNSRVYHIKSRPLTRKELKDSPGENKTFFVKSSPSKVLNDLVKRVKGYH